LKKNGKPIAVVSIFHNLLLPGALAAALDKGQWLWKALTEKPAPWDGKSLITGRVPTSIELGKYESSMREAAMHGDVDKRHHMAVLPVETASAKPRKAVKCFP
jgi:hypothetical protein